MSSTLVSDWFAERFQDLHPTMRQLHRQGGELCGQIELSYGKGIAGFIGGRIARKLKLPAAGQHDLLVTISHTENSLLWSRCFNEEQTVCSSFTPVGNISNGYWIESTGAITLELSVDTAEGAWIWRPLRYKLFNFSLPPWLFPRTTAYKRIEDNQYRFLVDISLPILGSLVHYEGLLDRV